MCEPCFLPNCLLVVKNSSKGVCSCDFASRTAEDSTRVPWTGRCHGREIARQPRNIGSGEESSNWNHATKLVFISSNKALHNRGPCDVRGSRSHTDRRGNFTLRIDERAHPSLAVHGYSCNGLRVGRVSGGDGEYICAVNWPIE
jgi:hypothetical protein